MYVSPQTKRLPQKATRIVLLALYLLFASTCAFFTTSLSAIDRAADFRAPLLLSETGLYAPGSVTEVDPQNVPFTPQYPLWTDGAGKRRWMYLPPGAQIDASDVDDWKFPVGTRFWKEFSFGGRPVETRMLWQSSPGQWSFATYLWRADGSDAELVGATGMPRSAEITQGKFHAIPGIDECRACHLAGANPVLGFGAMQLSPDRDPLALHAEPLAPGSLDLASLLARGWLSSARTDLLESPPRMRASSAETRSVLGYLAANCGTCHNSQGPLARLGLDLRAAARLEGALSERDILASLVGAADYAIPNVPAGSTRWFHPGAPELSSAVYRMSSRRPISQMPPLGTCLVDRQAVERISQWVRTDLAQQLGSAP